MGLIVWTPAGLFCPKGGFYIDPTRTVPSAIITHAHRDHVRTRGQILCTHETASLLTPRTGIETLEYGTPRRMGDVVVSLHPAGHILGSAQVRIAYDGEVWVVTGDFKRDRDPSCTPFEPVRCDHLIVEATFARSAYRWPPSSQVIHDICDWWKRNEREGVDSVLSCYVIGKTQRILAELVAVGGCAYVHDSALRVTEIYRRYGIRMLAARPLSERCGSGNLIIAPGRARIDGLGSHERRTVSGWALRGRGFPVSDHADWPGLVDTIRQSGARSVHFMHGDAGEMIRYFRRKGIVAARVEEMGGSVQRTLSEAI